MITDINAIHTLHMAATLFMTGLIWFVQIVHYPLFQAVPPDHFPGYETQHVNRTTWVVTPPMIVELLTGAFLFFSSPTSEHTTSQWAQMFLLAIIWMSTLVLQIPIHQRIQKTPTIRQIRALILSNWIRTGAWSIRSILLLFPDRPL